MATSVPPAPTPIELSAGRPEDRPTPTLFSVEVAGVPITVDSISGLGAEVEVIQFQDGDDLILRKRPGRTSYATITL
jgi:hypothetical protein